MSITGIKGGFHGSGPMGAGPLKFSGNINKAAAAMASIGGGHGGQSHGSNPTSALGKAAKDMAAFVIIDSFLEAKGIHINHDALLAGIAAKGALQMYKATPGAEGSTNVEKISQIALAMSTFQAIG